MLAFLIAGLLLQASVAHSPVSMSRADGGSVVTDLGNGIAVNKGSSLHREWMTIHNDAMPADIQGTIGLDTEYVSQSFRATALVMLRLKEPIRAIDLRYVLFNAWGEIVDVRS